MRAQFVASALAVIFTAAIVAGPTPADQGKTEVAVPQSAEGEGVVRALDVEAGSITLWHSPIAALRWPAMTMKFGVSSPGLLNDLAVGQRVHFVLVNDKGRPIVSEIRGLQAESEAAHQQKSLP